MNEVAIRVEKLSKRYRIVPRQASYATLREALTNAAKAPFRRIYHALRSSPDHPLKQPRDHIWALKDASFEIGCGEVVGIIGRNGAGKSTLLRILSRITEPTEGYADVRGRVGALLEVGTGFHPELTGRENVFLNGAILGMKRAEINRKFDAIVEFAGVETFVDTPVKHYSSGMCLRLAFAVAAHLEPDILLVDEVLAVGDASFQRKCLGRLEDVAEGGRTVLFVSHNMGAVRSLCRKGIVLDGGKIKASGDIEKCIECYYRMIGAFQNDNGDNNESEDRTGTLFGPVLLKGAEGNTIEQSKGFVVTTVLNIAVDVNGFALYCRLGDMHGRTICLLHEKSSSMGMKPVVAGRHLVTVAFPPLWLNPGLYSIDFIAAFWTNYDSQQQVASDKFPLDVVGTNSGTNTILHPHVGWSIKRQART